MVFGRRRRGLRRRGPATGGPEAEQRIGTRFVMRQKMFAFGDVFVVTDEHGTKMFEVDGKVFRLRDRSQADALLMLAITVCVDMLAHKGR
jgi:uncharacterized protein YxjI